MSTIQIPITDDIARRYALTTPEQQRKVQLLLGLRLRELVDQPDRSWHEAMDTLCRSAAARGLTPATLHDLLDGD